MKLLKSSMLILALAAFALLGLTSCNEGDLPVDTDLPGIMQQADDFIAYESLEASELKDATIEAEPALITPDCDNNLEMPDSRRGEQMRGPKPPRHPFRMFGQIFREMEMTQEQMEALRPFFEDHIACTRELLMALRESEREILEAAREERAAILAQLRNEEITREEARELLQALNLETRTALQENPLREETRLALKDCRDALLENIASVLTEEQLILWEEWLAQFED